MATEERSCYIYIQLPRSVQLVPCALLRLRTLGANLYEGTFVYGKSYLQRDDVAPLDPFHLPLTSRPKQFTKLKGIPGAIRDASPDAWGRRVIQAKLNRKEDDLEEMDYLLNGPDDGAGNLSFGRTANPPSPQRPFNRTHQLQQLIEAAQALQEDGRLSHEVLEDLEPGTSMGGARPKATIEDANKIWLAKFPEKDDKHNMQRVEYATLELARKAGIRVCETRLEKVGQGDVLMLGRFDREWDPVSRKYFRHGLVSGLTILDAEDGYTGRERWSYLLLADELQRWSSNGAEDRKELFRRMVFNAMVTNNDDHPRNHAVISAGGGWRLSPAYDIVPKPMVSQERRDLALTCGAFGRAASRYNLLSQADVFGLKREEAEHEMNTILHVVEGWREHFSSLGVEHRTIQEMEQAILPASFYRDTPPDPV